MSSILLTGPYQRVLGGPLWYAATLDDPGAPGDVLEIEATDRDLVAAIAARWAARAGSTLDDQRAAVRQLVVTACDGDYYVVATSGDDELWSVVFATPGDALAGGRHLAACYGVPAPTRIQPDWSL